MLAVGLTVGMFYSSIFSSLLAVVACDQRGYKSICQRSVAALVTLLASVVAVLLCVLTIYLSRLILPARRLMMATANGPLDRCYPWSCLRRSRSP